MAEHGKKGKKAEAKEETKDYRMSLNPVKRFPPKKRAKRAMTFIRRFVTKNTRIPNEDVAIAKDVNEAVWTRGIRNIPNKIEISVLIEGKKARVFLKDSKGIKAYIEEKKAEKKKKEEKEAEKKKEEKAETKEEKKEANEQEKIEEQKKEEKKLKEKYSEAIEMKRK